MRDGGVGFTCLALPAGTQARRLYVFFSTGELRAIDMLEGVAVSDAKLSGGFGE